MDASLQQYLEEILRQMATDPRFMERRSGGTPGGIEWTGPKDQPGAMNLKAIESLLTMSDSQEKNALGREQLKNAKDIAGMTMAGQLGAQSMREKTLDDRQLRTYSALRSKLASRMLKIDEQLRDKNIDPDKKTTLMGEMKMLQDQLDYIESQIAAYQPEEKKPVQNPTPGVDNPINPVKTAEVAKATVVPESAMSGQPGQRQTASQGQNATGLSDVFKIAMKDRLSPLAATAELANSGTKIPFALASLLGQAQGGEGVDRNLLMMLQELLQSATKQQQPMQSPGGQF